jgi:hypothetical protein
MRVSRGDIQGFSDFQSASVKNTSPKRKRVNTSSAYLAEKEGRWMMLS